MHAAMNGEPAAHHENPQSLARLSPQEKLDNHQRNEEQLDKETRWEDLQAQVQGTLSFLDSESSWKAFKLFNNASRPGKAILSYAGPDSNLSSSSSPPQAYHKQAVFYPKSSRDVLAAVNFAYKNGIDISVKSGGYNPSSWSTSGTLIIDLKELKSVIVHPVSKSVTKGHSGPNSTNDMQVEPTVHERGREQLTSSGLDEHNATTYTANSQKRKHSDSPDSAPDSAMPAASESMRNGSSSSASRQTSSTTSTTSYSSGSVTPPIHTLLAQQQAEGFANNEVTVSMTEKDKGKRRMLDTDRSSSMGDQTHFIHANAYPPFNLVNADPEQSRAFRSRQQSQNADGGSLSPSIPFIYDPIRKETVFPGNAPPGTVPFSDAPRGSLSGQSIGGAMHSATTSSAAADPSTAWPSVNGSRLRHDGRNFTQVGNGSSDDANLENAFGAANPSDYNLVSFGSGTTAQHLDSVSSTSKHVARRQGEQERPNELCTNDSGVECFVPWACYPVGSAIFLTGGYGFVSRLYGLSMDLVTEFEIVLPPTSVSSSARAMNLDEPPLMIDGELEETGRIVKLKVDYMNDPDLSQEEKQEQEELWWACRGAGTAFGIVTNITSKAYNIGLVLAGNVIFPFNPATTPSLLKHWRDCLKAAPRELYTNFTLSAGPNERGHVVVIQFSWCGKKIEEGETILQTMLSWDGERCLLKDVEVRPYKHQQENVSQILSSKDDTRWLVRSTLLNSLSDKSIHKTVDVFRKCRPGASWLFETAGGAIAEPQYPSCFPLEHRKAPFQVAALHQWTNPRDDEIQKKLAENWVYEVLKDEQCGPFPCFLSSSEKGDRVLTAYGKESYERLKILKRKYDPHCLLRHTHFEDALDKD